MSRQYVWTYENGVKENFTLFAKVGDIKVQRNASLFLSSLGVILRPLGVIKPRSVAHLEQRNELFINPVIYTLVKLLR